MRISDWSSDVCSSDLDYLIDTADLDFDLGEARTRVRARLAVRGNYDRAGGVRPLVLDGQELMLVSVALDGRPLGPGDYALDADSLTLPAPHAQLGSASWRARGCPYV